ncbi:MAG: tyrosine recombinase XerC [Oscillospiraceae bacterium]|nr:tyrosine recombinase XerC [Oscillospiraceae bacterium]
MANDSQISQGLFHGAPTILIDFLCYLQTVKGRSRSTALGYFFDLRIFFRYLKFHKVSNKKNVVFDEISISDVDETLFKSLRVIDLFEFINYVAENGNKASTRARKLASLKGFLSYLHKVKGVIKTNPASEIESPKRKKSLPVFLNLEQSKQLLESVKTYGGEHSCRDYCMVTFFLNCGMRLSELVGINLGDVKNEDRSLRITGKGNKERVIYLNDACLNALRDYLLVRVAAVGSDKNALFVSKNKRRISVKTVQYLLKNYFGCSGLGGKGFTVHKLRHTAATLMYQRGGVDIRILKEILGHESIATTEIYTHTSNEQVKKAMESNPLAEL